MAIRRYLESQPQVHPSAWVDESAQVIGRVFLDEAVSVWPNAVLRGDVCDIRIGAYSNFQDGAIGHGTHTGEFGEGSELVIGQYVTVGHNAILHGCRIGDHCLIGMGATVLDHSVVEDYVMIGANALVPAGKTLESGYLYLGSPAKAVRPLTEKERRFFAYSAKHYAKLKDEHAHARVD